jgi:uncharacterized protein YjbI with pentapeptide repeats
VRDKERVGADTEHQPADDQEDPQRSSVIPGWVFITVLAIFAGVVIVIIYGYLARPGWVGVSDKTFWDYLDLLIVPAAIAIGAAFINWMQSERQRQAEVAQQNLERNAEVARRDRELKVENQRAQDVALQAYFDQMSQLLLDRNGRLRESQEGDEVRTLARARTLTVLTRLDGGRKGSVLRFLYEADLITKDRLVLNLDGADLTYVDLAPENPSLPKANLRMADLSRVNLFGARLPWACLEEASLSETDLRGGDLTEANLREADLNRSGLFQTNLRGANFRRADLRGANLTNEQLVGQTNHLEGAFMPEGQKYEDWLETREGQN